MNISDHSSLNQLSAVATSRQPQQQAPSSLSQNPRFKNEVEIAEKLQLPAGSSFKIQGFQDEMLHTPQSELEQQFDELSGDLREMPAIARCGGLSQIESIKVNSEGLVVLHESCGAMHKPIFDQGGRLLGGLEKLQAMATILVQRRPPANATTAPQPQPSQIVSQPSFSATASQLVLRSNTVVTTSTRPVQPSFVANAQAGSSQQLQPSGTSDTSPLTGSGTALGTGTLLNSLSPDSTEALCRNIKGALVRYQKQKPNSHMITASQIKEQELNSLGRKLGANLNDPRYALNNSVTAILGNALPQTGMSLTIVMPPGYAITEYPIQILNQPNETIWVATRDTIKGPLVIDMRVVGNRTDSERMTLQEQMHDVVLRSNGVLSKIASNSSRSSNTSGV
jgi:hypothetical protein